MNFSSKRLTLILLFFSAIHLTACGKTSEEVKATAAEQPQKVLIFSKTTEWRHQSIEEGTEYLKAALIKKEVEVVTSEDASLFNDADLSTFSALVFLNTTGDVLNAMQQVAMERYIQAGGGYVGIHSASDTEWKGDWIWYRRLVGGVFAGHPGVPSNVQTARIQVIDKNHPSTQHMPDNFRIADEWYDFTSLSDRRIDLMKVDEKSYNGGGHKGYHPIAWYHNFDGGRSFYTGIGHNADNFANPLFMEHLIGGIEYAMGDNVRDYALSRPEPERFNQETLVDDLNEPVSLDITKDGSTVFIIERKGKINTVDTTTGDMTEIGEIEVFSAPGFGEFGLLTIALDPNFDTNQHMYLMYNVPSPKSGDGPLQRVARYTLVDGKLDNSSAVTMLDVPNDDTCCHTGGNMEFDAEGNLYIAMGDNTNPFDSFGVGPSDFREGQKVNDAYRSSANTQDYRGKILRITPQPDGSYSIPSGNLFKDAKKGKPEIYVMGTRNPYTLAFDDKEKTLYYGDVGPDAKEFTENHGAKGHDEVNRVRQAGNFGWPLFIGNNKAYRQFDYDTEEVGSWNNPLSPRNTSPLNTGAEWLPPAQPAFIWYPYGESEEFPELGAGSRNALVAGVYRTKSAREALPSYYEGGLFISDFMRRWVKVVFTDKNGDIYKIEEFAPSAEFVAPLDLKFSHQGQLYVLEYGSKWHHGNVDARLSRVVYDGSSDFSLVAKSQSENAQSGEASSDADNKDGTLGHQADPMGPGRAAAKKYLCMGCHQEQDASVGPSFQEIADKYADEADPLNYLKNTIAAGSTGKWGQHQMPAHDFLSDEIRVELASYILLLKSE